MSCYGESRPKQTRRTTKLSKLPKCHSIIIISVELFSWMSLGERVSLSFYPSRLLGRFWTRIQTPLKSVKSFQGLQIKPQIQGGKKVSILPYTPGENTHIL